MGNSFDEIQNQLRFSDVAQPKNHDNPGKSTNTDYYHCGICSDSDAALKVYDGGNWKCHSCGATGLDIVNYKAQKEDVGQGKAAAQLIEEHNLDIEFGEVSEEEKKKRRRLRKIRNCQEHVVDKAVENLSTAKKQKLKDWRDWSDETIKELRIGWMDESLFNELKERYSDLLEEAGIHYGMTDPDHDSDGTYLIPHLKKNGQPYLITCRHEHNDGKRYEQSKSTEYVENDIFYATGHDSDTLIVTEGYPDAISGFEAGYDAVAAGCGSFEGNRNRVKRFSENYSQVLVVLDNDETGKEELQKIGKHLSKSRDVLIHRWPDDTEEGYDLDDWTSDNGYDLEKLFQEAVDFLEAFKSYKPSQINAELVGEQIMLRGRIKSQKQKYSVPKKIVAECTKCSHRVEIDVEEEDKLDKLVLGKGNQYNELQGVVKREMQKNPECIDERNKHDWWHNVQKHLDKTWMKVQDSIDGDGRFSVNQDNTVEVYLVGDKLPETQAVKIKGTVEVDKGQDGKIVVLGRKVSAEEEGLEGFELSAEEHQEYREEWEKSEAELMVDPDMVGRPLSRTALQLAVHSPTRIPTIDGDITRGALRVMFAGDGGTNKSKQVKKLTKDGYQLGGYVTAETGSRTGMLYTIDSDRRVIEWGELPLNDRGLLGIDGFNKMHGEELTEMREALESMTVEVSRSVKGSAPARTRIIACMNTEQTPMLHHYKNAAKAFADLPQFEGPDYRRWDLFVPFSEEDVDKKKIAFREGEEKPYREDFYRRHVLWAWSLEPEDIVYSQGFADKLKTQSYNLQKAYQYSDFQVVSPAFREKLNRLAVSWAVLRHNLTEDGKVKVTAEDVEDAASFFEDLMEEMGIESLIEEANKEKVLEEDELEEYLEEFSARQFRICQLIADNGSMSSGEIAEDLDIDSDKTVKRAWKSLKSENLIETKPGKGVGGKPRLVQLVRKIDLEKVIELKEQEKCPELHDVLNDGQGGGGDEGNGDDDESGENDENQGEKETNNPPPPSQGSRDIGTKRTLSEEEFIRILENNEGVLHYSEIEALEYDADTLEKIAQDSDKVEKGFGTPEGGNEVENRFELAREAEA